MRGLKGKSTINEHKNTEKMQKAYEELAEAFEKGRKELIELSVKFEKVKKELEELKKNEK